ncbi:hypothetical protein [Streptomyces sp. NPDC088135]|uniref:hypothetical protein n=1 Tax=Streptomyces sp. NPDC088135 TaxID=3160993 RepID=UPI003438D0FB
MLCSTCRLRPPVTDDGRCLLRAGPAGAATAPMRPVPAFYAPQQYLRSPEGLAKAVVVLLALIAVADLLAVAAELNVRRVIAAGIANDFATYDEAEATLADNMSGSAGGCRVSWAWPPRLFLLSGSGGYGSTPRCSTGACSR